LTGQVWIQSRQPEHSGLWMAAFFLCRKAVWVEITAPEIADKERSDGENEQHTIREQGHTDEAVQHLNV